MTWQHKGSRHANGYRAAWQKARAAALERDGYLYQPCLGRGLVILATAVHHVMSKAQDGTDDLDNLASTCGSCHDAADLRNRGHRPKRRIGPYGYPVE
jgi:5-methylcytosine-specific restriction protein A